MKKFWKKMKFEDKDVAINQNLFDSINNILYNNIEHTKAKTYEIEEKEDYGYNENKEKNDEKSNSNSNGNNNLENENNNEEDTGNELIKDKIKITQILGKNERDKINNIKVDLSNINSNTNFAKFAHISTNIYIEYPEYLRITYGEMFKFFLKPAYSFSEQTEKINGLKSRISNIKSDPDAKKK